MDAIREFASDISDLFWFGYIVAMIGVFTDIAGGPAGIWITLYAFGVGVCLIDTATTYYNDYIRPFYVSTESTTETE